MARGPLAAAVLATALVGLGGCTRETPRVEVVRPVLTQTVAARSFGGAGAVYSGDVRPRYENDLAFRIGGKVVARLVEVGATVTRGSVLARLDPQDQRLQVEGAQAQLGSAEADLTLAKAELERYRSLRAQNFVSQAVLDAKENAFNAAEARIRQLKAQADVARNAAAYTALVAERDGIITAINVEAGQVVAAGQPVMRFARPEEREVLVNVPESRLAEWRSAPAIAVTLWSLPGKTYRGRVREVSPTADPTTRTFNVRVSILDADASLRIGMTANVALAAAAAEQAIIVPLTAVGDRNGQPVVWLVDAGANTVAPKPVRTGAYREDGVVVLDGLAGGETIVTVGVNQLVPGQKVRPEPDRRNTAAAPSAPLLPGNGAPNGGAGTPVAAGAPAAQANGGGRR
jgi:RND family efflux transporter MFP subunit